MFTFPSLFSKPEGQWKNGSDSKNVQRSTRVFVCVMWSLLLPCLIENRNRAISSVKFQEDFFGISEVSCVQTDGRTEFRRRAVELHATDIEKFFVAK